MIDDTRNEALQAPRPVMSLMGLRLIPVIAALASNDLAVAYEPGVAVVGDKVQEFAGDGDVVCYSGETLTDASEIVCAVVACYNPDANLITILVVDGDEALTSAGAEAPTDDDIEAALPSSSCVYTLLGTVKFARSGSAISQTIDHTVRSFGVPTTGKFTASTEDPVDDSTLFEHAVTLSVSVDAADIANGDVLTTHPVPAFFGKVGAWRAVCEKAITTTGKTATLNLEIGTTDIDGTSTAYAGAKVLGAVTALNAPTAGHASNAFKPGDTFSVEAGSVTAFIEGRVRIEVDFYRRVS